MLKAARLGDEISHTRQRSGLIGGMLLGALLVGAVLLTVATGGTALFVIGALATGAAVGGGIGRLWGSEQTVVKGKINQAATTVFINSRGTPAARACVDTALCDDHRKKLIATGSTTVFIEAHPAARVSDTGACSFKISQGSDNVFIGEETGQCAGVEIEPEVEPWLEWTHRITGWVGGLCLLGPAFGLRVAIVSLIGGEIGAHYGGQLGQKYFGKWGGVGGAILGGILGGGIPLRPGVRSFVNRLEVDPTRLGTAGGNLRLRPTTPPKTLLPGEGNVGTYRDLSRAGSRGDNLTPHHMPSDGYMQGRGVPGYTRDRGISMNMEQPRVGGRHRQTSTYGRPPDLTLTPRQALARDIRDARRIYQQDGLYTPEIRRALQDVIQRNKDSWGTIFDKPPRGQ
jgi:uncharacterized Zn-binding protein involved in type VI secretion